MARGAARKPSEKPTAVSAWRKDSKPELIELPSGKRALLKRPSAFATMHRGEIPNALLKYAMETIDPSQAEVDPQDDRGYNEYMLFIISRTFVEPPFFHPNPEKPDEEAPADALTVDDVEDQDLIFVYSWSQGLGLGEIQKLVEELGPFLEERAGGGDGESRADVRPEAVGAPGD